MGEKIVLFILSLFMIVLIAMIPLVIYLEIKQEQYMKEQHCKLVVPEVSETHYIHGTMLVGKVIVCLTMMKVSIELSAYPSTLIIHLILTSVSVIEHCLLS